MEELVRCGGGTCFENSLTHDVLSEAHSSINFLSSSRLVRLDPFSHIHFYKLLDGGKKKLKFGATFLDAGQQKSRFTINLINIEHNHIAKPQEEMRLRFAVAAVLFIAQQASLINGHSRLFPKALLPSQPHVYETVRRAADVVLARALDGAPSIGVATPVKSPSTLSARSDDSGTWEKDTELACQNALSKVGMSSISPSGMSACYNIRYFDSSTGGFQSELRLYRMAPPAGNWTRLDAKWMSIGIACKGASLAQGDLGKRKRDGGEGRALKAPRRIRFRRQSNTPSHQPLQVLQFVGKLHDDRRSAINNPLVPFSSPFGHFRFANPFAPNPELRCAHP